MHVLEEVIFVLGKRVSFESQKTLWLIFYPFSVEEMNLSLC